MPLKILFFASTDAFSIGFTLRMFLAVAVAVGTHTPFTTVNPANSPV